MNNPIAVFQHLRELYLRYLDSPLAIRYEVLRDERRRLLDEDRRMWRQPLIEPTPVYPTCDGDFTEVMHELLDQARSSGMAGDIADFLSPSLFPDRRKPYLHQREAFRRALV